ncbi:MAG TPA: hypothetical protein VIM87_12370, partial [Chitinophaga sp.]|uniref:hypothetical protein n=1 Tax=Chitinophaga sp. TaxID=1869181 RepID=UPI002F92F546
ILGWTKNEFLAETGIKRQTLDAYLLGTRGKNKAHKAFYIPFLNRTGIDLNISAAKGHIVIVDPHKLPPGKIARLKEAGAEILQTPLTSDNNRSASKRKK